MYRVYSYLGDTMDNLHTLFQREPAQYRRDLDIKTAYFQDMITGISKKYGISVEKAQEFVLTTTSENGKYPFKDKLTRIVAPNEYGDRQLVDTTFLSYVTKAQENDMVLSPSMVIYENPDREHSISSKFIAVNVKARGVAKDEMKQAESAGLVDLQISKNNEQKNKKLDNNALSGAHVSASTILHKPSIHTSLTSMCRCAANYGNANNEKIIAGNRHYFSPDIIEANILATIRLVNLETFGAMVIEHNLVYPTVDQAMEVAIHGSHRYFKNPKRMDAVRHLLEGITPLERAAWVYIGDLYHICKFNQAFVFKLLDRLSCRDNPIVEMESSQILKVLPEDGVILVAHLCADLLAGKSIKAVKDMPVETQQIVAATAYNVFTALVDYHSFIREIFVTDIMPSSVWDVPSQVREAVLAGDTDSTIFSVQNWLEWRFNEISFKPEAVNFGHAVAFLTSASIINVLAIMSKNVGVRDRQLFQYAMKSEFYFSVFLLTSRAKTYAAIKAIQEGIVKSKFELERKGAVLKGSNTPEFIMEKVETALIRILKTVRADEKIRVMDYLTECADLERSLEKGLRAGDTTFYKRAQIKPAETYKKGQDESPYSHYLLWKEVFADKYGHTVEPPYAALKINLESDGSQPMFNKWLASIEDPVIRDKLIAYLKRTGKTKITNVIIPQAIANLNGVPTELLEGMGLRKIISTLLEPYYVLLEPLGQFFVDDNQLRLVSDFY